MSYRILRRPDVQAVTGLSRSSIYQGVSDGWFPRPVTLGPGTVGWLQSEIDSWIEERAQQRDARR